MKSITNLVEVSKQEIGSQEVNAVNARELHEFLGSKQQFSHWIQGRISQFDFTEGDDYQLDKILYNDSSDLTTAKIEYYITLDMAKELSMVERNDQVLKT